MVVVRSAIEPIHAENIDNNGDNSAHSFFLTLSQVQMRSFCLEHPIFPALMPWIMEELDVKLKFWNGPETTALVKQQPPKALIRLLIRKLMNMCIYSTIYWEMLGLERRFVACYRLMSFLSTGDMETLEITEQEVNFVKIGKKILQLLEKYLIGFSYRIQRWKKKLRNNFLFNLNHGK